MELVSYAQHGEDILLSRLFHGTRRGYYVDIGANDPDFCSVTKHFYERSWNGINVEPVPDLHSRLEADRPRNRNLNLGISNVVGTLTFYESPTITGWSTFSTPLAKVYRRRGLSVVERLIPVTTLTRLFAEYVDQPVDFLKIDVEGHEREVLEGVDWTVCRPRVLVLEDSNSDGWAHLVPESDYLQIWHDGINRFYVRREESALLASWAATADLAGKFVHARVNRHFEVRLAAMASRDDLGPVARCVRSALSHSLRAVDDLRRRIRRAS